jgi:hypothetical protein
MEKQAQNKSSQDQLVRDFDSKNKKSSKGKVAVVLVAMIALGIGSGLLIAKGSAGSTASSSEVTSKSDVTKGKTFGVDDSSTFKDTAEGTLKKGGIEGEGQYHLVRPGGETQYVYVTSSVVDLGLVEGRQIKVWGQTQKAQHAPWLMDVGRVEVEN